MLFNERYAHEKKCSDCGHPRNAHMWNINENPEGEPSMEDLGCKECGTWNHRGDFTTGCKEFKEENNWRDNHTTINSDW